MNLIKTIGKQYKSTKGISDRSHMGMMKKSEGIRTRAVVIIMTFSLFGCEMQKLNGFGMVREN